MQSMYYIGLDVRKKTISYCVKDGSGRIHAEGDQLHREEGEVVFISCCDCQSVYRTAMQPERSTAGWRLTLKSLCER